MAIILILVAAVALWLLTGLLSEVRKRLAHRMVDWLLPDSQAVTFRWAYTVAWFARALTPSRDVRIRRANRWSGRSFVLAEVDASWEDVRAAMSEMDTDLADGVRVLAPLQFVRPLLFSTITRRLQNGLARCAWAILSVVPVVLFTVVFVGWLLRGISVLFIGIATGLLGPFVSAGLAVVVTPVLIAYIVARRLVSLAAR